MNININFRKIVRGSAIIHVQNMWTCRMRFSFLTPSRSLRLYFRSQNSCGGRIIFGNKRFFKTERWFCQNAEFTTCLSMRQVHTGENVANPVEDSEASCEHGSGAVPHREVIATLNACKSLEEQVYSLSSLLSLTDEDMRNRQQLCDSLTQVFRLYLPESSVMQYGSSVNMLGFRGSDVDVCVRTTLSHEKPLTYSKVVDIPFLEEVANGSIAPSVVANMHPNNLMRFLRRVIRRHCPDVNDKVVFVKSRCPLLKLHHDKFNLSCDLSVENIAALQNTKLLRLICHIDSRVRPLMQVLRYWGKSGKFVGGMDLFNSYGISLLVIFYLQNMSPPVLPPITELLAKSDYLKFGEILDEDLLAKSVKCIPASENKQTIEELLRGFFFFYAFYDFGRVMNPLNASSAPRAEFQKKNAPSGFEMGPVCLLCPYRPAYNATMSLDRAGTKFSVSLVKGCSLFQNSQFLKPSLTSENWGLSQLLDAPEHYVHEYKKSNRTWTDSFAVELPVRSSDAENALIQASHLVKTILQDCFLFNCKELKVDPGVCKTLPLLKFSCESIHNTLVGRDRILKEKINNSTAMKCLELEQLISRELISQRQNKEVLFRLVCECYSGEGINSPSLNVTVKFESYGLLPVTVCIFLKDHVPRILKCALQEANS